MSGLLYKDFISVKGKKLTITFLVIFAVMIAVRILMPYIFSSLPDADLDMGDMMADGLYWIIGMLLFTMMFGTVICSCPTKLVEDDKTRGRVIDYYSSLPVTKKQYIASHYIFIGIMAYVVFSFSMIWYVIGSSLCRTEQIKPLWNITQLVVFSFVLFSILCAAIDLGAFISLGSSKGKAVRVAMLMLLCTAILWYFFFGDVKDVSLEIITNWIMAHQFELSLVEVTGPFIVLSIYYLSYRISCHFCDKGAY